MLKRRILSLFVCVSVACAVITPASANAGAKANATSGIEYSSLLDCGEVANETGADGIVVARGDKAQKSVGFGVMSGGCVQEDQTGNQSSAPENDEAEGSIVTAEPLDSSQLISYGPGECQWRIIDPPPAAGSPAWEGNDPSTGSVITRACNGDEETLFMPGNNPLAPPPPPDPAVLAQQAYSELTIPDPTIGAGPDRTKLSVNLWTWLWIDNPGPQTVTVAAGGVSVTATATLTSVTWSLGEPARTGEGYAPGPPVAVTCQGTGTAPPPGYDWKAEPPCGYMFHWRSLKERTDGTGKWPIAATSTWTVTWQSNTGVTGGTTLTATGNDAFDIGEYRTVLVRSPGG